jgi:hypothetical protein
MPPCHRKSNVAIRGPNSQCFGGSMSIVIHSPIAQPTAPPVAIRNSVGNSFVSLAVLTPAYDPSPIRMKTIETARHAKIVMMTAASAVTDGPIQCRNDVVLISTTVIPRNCSAEQASFS